MAPTLNTHVNALARARITYGDSSRGHRVAAIGPLPYGAGQRSCYLTRRLRDTPHLSASLMARGRPALLPKLPLETAAVRPDVCRRRGG